MTTVLFACIQNAGRSQMAAAFFNEISSPAVVRAISGSSSQIEQSC
jgi:arsenate reductase